MPENRVGDILEERAKTHGYFSRQARISVFLKSVLHNPGEWHPSAVQQEALEMILHKVARIVAGDPNHRDHWDDIAGYATLVADRIGAKDEED